MSINMTMATILKKHCHHNDNIFTYDKTVRIIVKEIKLVLNGFPKAVQQKKLEAVSNYLHTFYYDVYEESKRESDTWNRYFFNIVKEVPIVEIDSGWIGDVPEEIEDTEEVVR